MVIAPSSKAEKMKQPDERELGPIGFNDGSLDDRRSRTANHAVQTNIVDHPIACHALSCLRNKQTTPARFRVFSTQLLFALASACLKSMPMREEEIPSLNGPHAGHLFSKPVVFLPLARAGLSLTHALSDLIPEVSLGSISLESSGDSRRVEPRLHIVNAPSLSSARVLIFDPVISSGFAATVGLHLVRNSGANDCALLTFVASASGLRRLHTSMPDVPVWAGAVDSEETRDGRPVPGLGDFSRRLYS
jgi:uracil phosphoribosyltransferase